MFGVFSKIKEKIVGKGTNSAKSDMKVVGYVMWYNPIGKKSGRQMVTRFDHYPSAVEIDSAVNAYGREGYYSIQEVIKTEEGEIFGKVLWKQSYVYEDSVDDDEVVEKKTKRRRKNDLFGFVSQLKEMQKQFEELADVGTFLARIGGKNVIEVPDGKSMEDYIIEMMEKLRGKYEKMRDVFGDSKVNTEGTQIPVEGKIPAWVVFAPKVVDQVMDNVEKRMKRWGLIGEEEVSVPDFPDVPEFPKME